MLMLMILDFQKKKKKKRRIMKIVFLGINLQIVMKAVLK
jgi:hypothetical protein